MILKMLLDLIPTFRDTWSTVIYQRCQIEYLHINRHFQKNLTIEKMTNFIKHVTTKHL